MVTDLTSKGYFQNLYNDNGFGGSFVFSVDSQKGFITISTDIADSVIRSRFINSYKNTYKPVQGSGNTVDTTFVIPTSIMHSNGQFSTGITVQSVAPDATTNKFWYDTTSGTPTLKISDGSGWKTLAVATSSSSGSGSSGGGASATSLGSVSYGNSALACDANLKDRDIKYVYDTNTGKLLEYVYYSANWYDMGNFSSSYSIAGTPCDDGNANTINDTIRSTGICKGESTHILADIVPGDWGSTDGLFGIEYKNKFFFMAWTMDFGFELWVYDGVNPPSMVADINPYGDSLLSWNAVIFNDKLYFSADDGINGTELWVYDGVNPSSMVADIYPGTRIDRWGNLYTNVSGPRELIVYNNKLYFAATNNNSNYELWVYDGVNPPSMAANLNIGIYYDYNMNANLEFGSNPYNFQILMECFTF